jgi:methionine-gamma-lyase
MTKRSNRRGLRTTAIHAGEAPDPETGASAPNLVMSTTYALERPQGFSIHAIGEDAPYIYTRWSNPTVRQLEAKLAALEGAEACQAFASGMAASAGLLLSLLSSGDHLVMSDVNYAGTAELARQTLPRLGIEVTAVDSSDLEAVSAAFRANTRLLWIETPANPILRLSDIRALSELAQGQGARIAVDSTFATPVATRPIELGADFVVHSLTKYIGGHGDALGGAVLGSAADIRALNREATIHHGGVLSPFNAWLILRGAATLPLRMKAHGEGALAVARFLESHPKVERVLYPGLASHPQHELARRQMDNFSGMMAFQVADGPAAAARMAARMDGGLEVIHYAVSLGHHRSLIYWIGTDEVVGSSFTLEGAQLDTYRAFAGDGVFRFSVGLEDPEDLCADLDRVL